MSNGGMPPFNRGRRGPFDDQVLSPSQDTGVDQAAVATATHGPGTPPSSGERTDPDESIREQQQKLLSVVQREIDSSLGWTGTRLAEARRVTLRQWMGNPRGDEREGYSEVVTRDVLEVVEGAMPDMMDIFTSSDTVVEFLPQGPEDEEGAKQATDAVNYVYRQCEGFMALYTAFKDAFIQKNGVGKVWWEETDEVHHEDYEGKNLADLVALEADPNYEIEAVEATYQGQPFDMQTLAENLPLLDPQGLVFDIQGKRVCNTGGVRIDNIPPEEFIINRDARGLSHDTCRFVGHRIRTSESQLLAWGYPQEIVESLPGSQSVYTTDQDAIIRASQDDSHPLVFSYRQDSERTIYVTECYIKYDSDGDGISEWWKVVVGGDYGQALLDAEPCTGHPFFSVTPIPIPHRFYGYGLADITSDIQEITTTAARQFLNAGYLAQDPISKVLCRGVGEESLPLVNLDQLAQRVPGGWIEVYDDPNALTPYQQDLSTMDRSLQMMELMRRWRTDRTGVGAEADAVDPNAISKHVYGAMIQTSSAAKRKTLYARVFAETGVKDMFKLIYQCLLQNQTEPMVIRLRGSWTQVDPRSWKHGMDCQIAVGLGHSSRMEKVANAQAIGAMQEKVGESPYAYLIQPQHVQETFSVAVEAMGFKNPDRFIGDPEQMGPPPQPEPTPADNIMMMQAEKDLQDSRNDAIKLQLQAQENALKEKEIELKYRVEMAKLGQPAEDVVGETPQAVTGNGAGAQA